MERLFLKRCESENMIADILTKPLRGEQFFKLRAVLLGRAKLRPSRGGATIYTFMAIQNIYIVWNLIEE